MQGKICLQNNLQQIRQDKKLTQEELANAVGVTRQTIIAIEKGNYTPSVLLAINIARYFKVSVEKIFQVKNNKL
jgi:putative transcriptional regulator